MAKNLPAGLKDLAKGLANVQNFAHNAVEDLHIYVKMGKDGFWTFGTDETPVEDNAEWAVNPLSFATGYSAFDANGSRLGEEMRNMTEPPIMPEELPVVGANWIPQIGFELCCLNGEDKGLNGQINQRSRGGMSESAKLLSEVIDRVEKGNTEIVAIISLHNDSYKHSKYGKIFTPVYQVERWATMDETMPEEEHEPQKPHTKTEPKEQIEETKAAVNGDDEAKPVRRRRRNTK